VANMEYIIIKQKKKDNKTVQSSIATLWQSNLGL